MLTELEQLKESLAYHVNQARIIRTHIARLSPKKVVTPDKKSPEKPQI